MYNEKVKSEFIEEVTNSDPGSVGSYTRLFRRSEQFETQRGKDISALADDDFSALLEEVGGRSKKALGARVSEAKKYIRWCVENGVSGARAELLQVVPQTTSNQQIRKYMVKSPGHLARAIRVWKEYNQFDAIHPGSELMYEAFWWLAYSGMDAQDAMIVRGSDVDFEQMVIRVGGLQYPIYPPGAKVLEECVKRKTIYYDAAHNGKRRQYPRADGDQLLRTRSEMKISSMRTGVSQCKSAYVDDNPDCVVLRYNSLQDSGIFYEMYLQEEVYGMPVDFAQTARKLITRRAERENKQYKIDVSSYQMSYKLSVDYSHWKKVFY